LWYFLAPLVNIVSAIAYIKSKLGIQ
jgi:SLT domain-containing protein